LVQVSCRNNRILSPTTRMNLDVFALTCHDATVRAFLRIAFFFSLLEYFQIFMIHVTTLLLMPTQNKTDSKMNGVLFLLVTVSVITIKEWSAYQPSQGLYCQGFSLASFSSFHGTRLHTDYSSSKKFQYSSSKTTNAVITMRKQKASDRRTRRMQRGGEELVQDMIREKLTQSEITITSSPMDKKGKWKQRKLGTIAASDIREKTKGRGRSRKRSILYNSLSCYHNKFLTLLTKEYLAEVSRSVLSRKINSYRRIFTLLFIRRHQ
jgi:hypothetical protein